MMAMKNAGGDNDGPLFQRNHTCAATSPESFSPSRINLPFNYHKHVLREPKRLSKQTHVFAPTYETIVDFDGSFIRHYSLGRFICSETTKRAEPWRLVAEAAAKAKPKSADAIGVPQPGPICTHAVLSGRSVECTPQTFLENPLSQPSLNYNVLSSDCRLSCLLANFQTSSYVYCVNIVQRGQRQYFQQKMTAWTPSGPCEQDNRARIIPLNSNSEPWTKILTAKR